MNYLPGGNQATTARWSDLVDELDRWGEAGRVATLWWRDDDAAAPNARLDRLLSIADDIPIALAVIPAAAATELAAWLRQLDRSGQATPIDILQHGWRHVSHAGDGKKSEFPPGRSPHAVISDLAAGRTRLKALFGARALAVLVPPWNRFDPSLLPLLAACGLTAISRVKPRRAASPGPGIGEVNVHVDLVAWAGNRGFIGETAALEGIIEHLRARRLLEVDAEEPTGILTHHLVQDEATDPFLQRFVSITRAHPATRWLAAENAFADTVCLSR